MFLNETVKDTPAVSNLSPGAKQQNHFEQFTYVGDGNADSQKKKEKHK